MPSWEDGSERYLAEYRGETIYDMGAGESPLPLEGDMKGPYSAYCECGWNGPERMTRHEADHDRTEHYRATIDEGSHTAFLSDGDY